MAKITGEVSTIKKELRAHARKDKANDLSRFFKTGKGEYGEGDRFIGVMVPQTRSVAKKHKGISFQELQALLKSEWHEERLCGVLILVEKFKAAGEKERKRIFDFYIRNSRSINNWDLVDLSASRIVGAYLEGKDKALIYEYAKSENLWRRRIAIISTLYYINNNEYDDALKISNILLHDNHDLIRKAVGWMLREIGKRNQEVEEKFLRKHHKTMPRTMLRYAIERFPEKKRKFYMKK